MEINNNLQNQLVETINQTSGVASQIAMKVMKDSTDQVEEMLRKLIVDKPVKVTPKTDYSTYEFIV